MAVRVGLWCMRKRFYSTANTNVVGFIGVGNMGGPMASNLMAKGHSLVIHDTDASRTEELVKNGATLASSPADVAKQCKTIVTMLPEGRHVKEVYAGLFTCLQKGTLLIDSSTIDPAVNKEVAGIAVEQGSDYIDAPVSGGVGAAQKGMLSFMVGGEEKVFDQAKPFLECMGQKIYHCGKVGSGQAAKICNNMLLAISMIGTSEALQLGKNLGLDPKLCSQILGSSSGRCWSVDTYNPCPGVIDGVPSSNDYKGGFGTALMRKDLGLAQTAALDTHTITPLGSSALQLYSLMCQHGYSMKDFSSVFKFIESQSPK